MRILVEYCRGDYTATLMDEVGMVCCGRGNTKQVAIKRAKRRAEERQYTSSATEFEVVDMTDDEET